MNSILDTNMVYYFSEMSASNYDTKKMISLLKKHGTIYISELSMLEIYSHFRNDLESLKKIINFLSAGKYQIWPYFNKDLTIVNKEFNELIKDDKFLKYLADDSLRIRIKMETAFINYWATSIASIYLAINYNTKPIKGKNVKMFTKNLFNTIVLFKINDNIPSSPLWDILYEFYKNNNESEFKDKIVEYVLDICDIFINLLHVSDKGINFLDFINNYDKYDDKKNEIFENYLKDSFSRKIEKRRIQQTNLVNKEFIKELDDNLSHYESKVNRFMAPGIVKYYTVLFRKFFTLDNKKIEKNNIIDSLLLSYYPNNLIITADNDFLKIMNEINPSYYNLIQSFLKKR
jgi:hypothetical protein